MNLPANSRTCTSKFASSDTWINTAFSKALYSRFSTFLREKLEFFRHVSHDLGAHPRFLKFSKTFTRSSSVWRSTTGFAILKRNNRRRQTRKIVDGCFLRVADTFTVAPREKSSPDNGCETRTMAIDNYQSGFPRRSRPGATTNLFSHRERLRDTSDANRRRQRTQCAIT